jgi:hypothetical protein
MLMHKVIVTTSDNETDIPLLPLMEVLNTMDNQFWVFEEG